MKNQELEQLLATEMEMFMVERKTKILAYVKGVVLGLLS